MKTKIPENVQLIIYSFVLIVFMSSCALLPIHNSGNIVPLTADQDESLPSIRLNDCTFHLETMGNPSNPPVLFLHGGAMDYKSLLSLADSYGGESLADDYFLIFYDQRGKGLSQRFNSSEEVTFEKYLEDMDAIIDYYCGNQPVVIVSHSFGGIVTANYINTHPSRIAGAVFLEPGAFSSEFEFDVQEVSTDLSLEWVNDLMWGKQMMSPSDHEKADLNFAAIMLSDEFSSTSNNRQQTPFWRVGAAAQHWLTIETESPYDFTTNYENIMNEFLFIAGSASEALGVEFQKINMASLPNARMEIIEGAGHSDLVWADSGAVVPLILEYLNSLDSGL